METIHNPNNLENIDTFFAQGFYPNGDEYFESGFSTSKEAKNEAKKKVNEFEIWVRFNDGAEKLINSIKV